MLKLKYFLLGQKKKLFDLRLRSFSISHTIYTRIADRIANLALAFAMKWWPSQAGDMNETIKLSGCQMK